MSIPLAVCPIDTPFFIHSFGRIDIQATRWKNTGCFWNHPSLVGALEYYIYMVNKYMEIHGQYMEFWMTFHSVGNCIKSQLTKSIIFQRDWNHQLEPVCSLWFPSVLWLLDSAWLCRCLAIKTSLAQWFAADVSSEDCDILAKIPPSVECLQDFLNRRTS